MSVRDYAVFASKAQSPGDHPEQPARVIMTYPILEVFAPDGRLVFQGDNISENLALLRQPEIDPSKFAPVAARLRLQDIVSQVGEFRKHSQQLSGSNRYTFLSVSLSDCGSCRAQEKILQENKGAASIVQTNKLFLVLDP